MHSHIKFLDQWPRTFNKAKFIEIRILMFTDNCLAILIKVACVCPNDTQ